MKLLLTSSGISSGAIEGALIDLLGKPISECRALIVLAGIYPFKDGAYYAWDPIAGSKASRMTQLGWKAVGLLEITALSSIAKENWVPTVAEADAILVWGGDPLFLSYCMAESGLTELLPTLEDPPVYVGVSAGAIATASIFGETYDMLPGAAGRPLTVNEIVLPDGNVKLQFVTAQGMGLTDFAIIPHFQNPDHGDVSRANAAAWASRLPIPVYAIDEKTAIKVEDETVEVVSDGQWELFIPANGS